MVNTLSPYYTLPSASLCTTYYFLWIFDYCLAALRNTTPREIISTEPPLPLPTLLSGRRKSKQLTSGSSQTTSDGNTKYGANNDTLNGKANETLRQWHTTTDRSLSLSSTSSRSPRVVALDKSSIKIQYISRKRARQIHAHMFHQWNSIQQILESFQIIPSSRLCLITLWCGWMDASEYKSRRFRMQDAVGLRLSHTVHASSAPLDMFA